MPGPVDLRDVRRVEERERDDAPEERVDRHAGDAQGGDPEPEHVDDEEARQRPEQVDVERREQPHREEDRAGQAPQDGQDEPEDEDEDLGDQEQPDVDPERRDEVGKGVPEDLGVEERLLDRVPSGRVDDDPDEAREDDDRARRGDGDRAPRDAAA